MTVARLTKYNQKWQEKVKILSQELEQKKPKALRKSLQDLNVKWKNKKNLKNQAESRAEDALARKYALSDKLEHTSNDLKQVREKYSSCQNLCFVSLLYNIILLLLSMMNYHMFLNDLVDSVHWICDTTIRIGKSFY